MRTSVFVSVLSSLWLLCFASAADITFKNFSSSTDVVDHHHVHLGSGYVAKDHDNETYSTENTHEGYHKTSVTEHNKHGTPEYQNTEPEVLDFFRAASKSDAYEEKPEKKYDVHGVHLHHHMGSPADREKFKLLRMQVEGNNPDHSAEADDHDRLLMDHDHEKHIMEPEDETHDDDDHDPTMKMNHNESMHGMIMYFHTGVNEIILFQQWKVTTVGGLIGSMIGVFLLAMIYEGLKYFREHLFKKYVSSIQFSTVAVTGQSGRVTQVHKVERHHMMSWPHALQTLLHVVQIIMSYFLMLIFMTYNVWLCLAVILGAGVGYFIFGWKKATVVDITEHCH